MRIRRMLAAAVAGLVTLGIGATPVAATPAAAPDGVYNVWTWNVAGWTMNRGSTTNKLITVLVNSILNREADFVALNELCYSQYNAVRDRLLNIEWAGKETEISYFATQREDVCGDEPFGLAIFSRAKLGPGKWFTLSSDGGIERRRLLCAPLDLRPHLRFCTTHITPKNDVINGRKINETQLGEVLSRLEQFDRDGDTVIIAGDFNAQPHYGRLNSWYSGTLDIPRNSGNFGSYREVDDLDERCVGYGETTTPPGNTEGLCGQGKKIDLIFVRESRLQGTYSGDSLSISTECGGPCSDHRIVIGRVPVAINS